ncbi:hypothetical protein Hamer_G028860, partial [Homarus americanus]
MTRALVTILVVACLATCSSATSNKSDVLEPEYKIISDAIIVDLFRMGTAMLIVVGGCLLFRELALGTLSALETTEEEEEDGYKDRNDIYNFHRPSFYDYHRRRPYPRAMMGSVSLLTRVLNRYDSCSSKMITG